MDYAKVQPTCFACSAVDGISFAVHEQSPPAASRCGSRAVTGRGMCPTGAGTGRAKAVEVA